MVASPVVERGFQRAQVSSCGADTLPIGTWNIPEPGMQPMSPALAGRFSTTEPPGKSSRVPL